MPFITKDMASYARSKGISSTGHSSSAAPNSRSKKRVRDQPSSMAPSSPSPTGTGSSLSKRRSKTSTGGRSGGSSHHSGSGSSHHSGSGSSHHSGSHHSGSSRASSSHHTGSGRGRSSKGSSSSVKISRSTIGGSSASRGQSRGPSGKVSRSTIGGSGASRGTSGKVSTAYASGSSTKSRSSSSVKSRSGSSKKKKRPGHDISTYIPPAKQMSFDEKTLKYTVQLLKGNIAKLKQIEGPVPIDSSNEYSTYSIDFSKNLVPKKKLEHCEAIVACKHKDKELSDFPLGCKVYDSNKVHGDSEHFRILRILGRKHPSLLQTWNLFYDSAKHKIYVIQEYGVNGTLYAYVKHEGPLSEKQSADCCLQFAHALDYMSDFGLTHRHISPHQAFMCSKKPIRVKLSPCWHTTVYWDVERTDVIMQPCLSASKKPSKPDYRAPEMYGDSGKEVYDPIAADIWSLGATIFYCLSKKYPYDFSKENPNVDKEIDQNISSLRASAKCKDFLRKVLTPRAQQRMPFDQIEKNAWVQSSK